MTANVSVAMSSMRTLQRQSTMDSSSDFQRYWDQVAGLGNAVIKLGGLDKDIPLGNAKDLIDKAQELLGLRPKSDEISKKLGEINDNYKKIKDQMNQLDSHVKEAQSATAQRLDELYGLSEAILRQQQRDTAEILAAIGGVSGQISNMQNDMHSSFATVGRELQEIKHTLNGIGNRLDEINSKLDHVMNKQDWNLIQSNLSGHVEKIKYLVDAGRSSYSIVESSEFISQLDQVGHDTMTRWAEAAADTSDGLPFYLSALHNIIIGVSNNRPLIQVFMSLVKDAKLVTFSPAMLHLQYLMLQSQGSVMLGRARQILGQDIGSAGQDLKDRVEKQSKMFVEQYQPYMVSVAASSWLDSVGGRVIQEGNALEPEVRERVDYFTLCEKLGNDEMDLLQNNLQTGTDCSPFGSQECFIMVPDSRQVVCGIYAESRSSGLTIAYGEVIPGTTAVKNVQKSSAIRGSFYGAKNRKFGHVFAAAALGLQYTFNMDDYGFTDMNIIYDDRETMIDPSYAVIGFRFTFCNNRSRLEPVVSKWDPNTRTTSWTGPGGQAFVASLPDGKGRSLPRPGVCMTAHTPLHDEEIPGMLTHFKIVWSQGKKPDNQDCMVGRLAYITSTLALETTFGFEDKPNAKYEAIMIP